MRKVAVVLFVAVGVLGIGAVATADDDDGSGRDGARLNGYQEVQGAPNTAGSVSTRGFGSFHLKVNRGGQSVDYTLSYRGMESPVTQAHIHFAQRSVAGPIAVWLCDDPNTNPPGPPASPAQTPPVCPPTEGTVRGTIRPTDLLATGRGMGPGAVPGEWEEFLAAVKVGHTYANVHTVGFGAGEIRGQINDRDQKEYTGPPPFAFGGDNDDD
jgi:CHRD domain